MQHRISAGATAENDGRVLMVRHLREGHYDFWVCPGGGVNGLD
jgi:ADP-ribose pyrophosphatase YjhB (NUDIX family)